MKKMILGAAALAAATSFAAIESQNIVGYSTTAYATQPYNCITVGFTAVGDDATFALADVKAMSFDEASDMIQFLEPVRARTAKTYFSYESDWYENTEEWNDANQDVFDVGTGFLASLGSLKVELLTAGAVLQDPTKLDFTGKIYNMVGNPLPRAVKFSEIEPEGFDEASDMLQKLEGTRARTVKTYFAYDGDWYENLEDWNDAGEETMASGESMLGSFGSLGVKLTFPGAL